MVERLPFKEMVPGSNPGGRTRSKTPALRQVFAFWCEAERCFAYAKPRAGVASEFDDDQIRLVTTRHKHPAYAGFCAFVRTGTMFRQ